jgi:cell division protein FtsW (lipid II flippase)
MSTYVIWAVSAVIGFVILFLMAKSRGRNPILWGIFGAVALLIALIAILIVGKSDEYEARTAG